MIRRLLAAALVLTGCAGDAPPATGTDNPAVTTPAELPASVLDSVAVDDGFQFRVDGAPGPLATYGLDDGGECIAYADRIVRLTPVDEDDASAGRTVELVTRTEGTSPFDQCDDEGEIELPFRPETDTFVALDGPVVWRLRDVSGRDLLIGYDVEADAVIFEEPATSPVVKDDAGLTYGGPPETMASLDALEAAGVSCPEAAGWFEAGETVAISRRLRFTFAEGTTADTGEARCFVQTDA